MFIWYLGRIVSLVFGFRRLYFKGEFKIGGEILKLLVDKKDLKMLDYMRLLG